MRLEFIDNIKEDDVLGKNILTNEGKILLRAGVKLTYQYINSLKKLGVFYAYIEDERLDDVQVEDERLTELKQCTMKNMSTIMKNVSGFNRIDMKEAISNVENLIDYIIEIKDVNKSLYDVKTYDNYTYMHCLNTGIMAAFVGMSIDMSEYNLRELGIGAILHDIGKTKISSDIINKEGPLTNDEFGEIKKHPLYGKEILSKNMFISDTVLDSVEQHHERVDGKGYPYGLQGYKISKGAKIISVCDVYDAVSSNRSYRKKFAPNEAYELILSGSGSAFDYGIVKKFKETFAVYPLGCCIKLSNGIEGYVVRQNKNFPDRPIIRVLYDSKTREPVPFYEVDLLESFNLAVECVIQ